MAEDNKYTFENEEFRQTYWHSCSHIMAQAVKRLWPEVKLAIGPAIDTGFYYDFDIDRAFTQEDLTKIEAIVNANIEKKNTIPELNNIADTNGSLFANCGIGFTVINQYVIIKAKMQATI